MKSMPLVAVATADACEVGAGALRAELERVVVHGLAGNRIVAIAFSFAAQPEHTTEMGIGVPHRE